MDSDLVTLHNASEDVYNTANKINRALGKKDNRIRELEEWQRKAFEAHPNIDIDIENLE